uniref:Ig-like domain-containing protein n=1 Tax=Cynoglossus semilaevis TaxID=244447 RepID=A0A3P8VPM0_CYNSE
MRPPCTSSTSSTSSSSSLSVFISFSLPLLLTLLTLLTSLSPHTDNMLGILCTLITALTYVDAAKVLTQTPAVHAVTAGQQVVLNCNIQRHDNDYVRWYKQVPGGVPQWVLGYRHSDSLKHYGSGFSSDRFNSKPTSDIDYQFIIKQTETGDSAQYFCLTWDDSAKEDVFGQGSKLIVTDSRLSPPVLTVFPPSRSELQSKEVTLVCLSSQSVPFADVTWLVGGTTVNSGVSTSTAIGHICKRHRLTGQTDQSDFFGLELRAGRREDSQDRRREPGVWTDMQDKTNTSKDHKVKIRIIHSNTF